MTPSQFYSFFLLAIAASGVFGYFFRRFQEWKEETTAHSRAKQIIETAKREAEVRKREAVLEGKDEILRQRRKQEKEIDRQRTELKRFEEKLRSREKGVKDREENISRLEASLKQLQKDLGEERDRLEKQKAEVTAQMEKLAGLSAAEAKAEMVKMVEDEARAEAAALVRKIEQEAEKTAEEKSRRILTIALERYASDVTTERTVTTVPLPSDDLKGRIIGREGRNIREFERLSGVELIIDDTPEAVSVSCFDPVRREVARLALTKLVADGRIHPTRIEEVLEKARRETEEAMRRAADEAAYELGIHNLRPEIIEILGRLRFRTSYGQNVLAHSKEVAHIGTMIATEMGLNVEVCKRACLLHDIGKAVDHEVEGPHALVGADLLKRYGEAPIVVDAVAGHHGDTEQSLEAVIVQVADAISASRPGVRLESAEHYVKRLETLENLAKEEEGVSKAYAIQAGREVRVLVNHSKVDDQKAKKIAKRIARKIESELSYPGQIRVTVIRETKFTDYAR
ncbi:MAG: ribonuclease Y [Candidatus Hydrogenedentota bacterium]|nr:MAG: ribonuclease Y [Candidatus Hydrogenedentota bacterium]